jgi:F-type H+-transporting ATPase subunit a
VTAPFPVLATEAVLNGPFEVPDPITELFEFPYFWFTDTIFGVNRVVLITLFASLLAMLFYGLAFRAPKIVPGKLQAAGELAIEFVRDQIAIQVMGPEGRAWVPFLTLIFSWVWLNNVFGIIPFVNFPATSRMSLPIIPTALIYITFLVVGVMRQGPGYFVNVAFPPGVPKALYILVTPIEIISTFIVRPLTLALRLFANMVAGHILLVIIFLAIHAFLLRDLLTAPIGLIGLVAAPAMIGFELVVGLLQAYIMTMLAAVYIGSSLHADH